METPESAVVNHYDHLAEHRETVATGPGKEHILFPALQSLLPELDGNRVLDAGCGDGLYTRRLAEVGGDMFGIDISGEMIDVARERHGDDAAFEQADLADEIPADTDASTLSSPSHTKSIGPKMMTSPLHRSGGLGTFTRNFGVIQTSIRDSTGSKLIQEAERN